MMLLNHTEQAFLQERTVQMYFLQQLAVRKQVKEEINEIALCTWASAAKEVLS